MLTPTLQWFLGRRPQGGRVSAWTVWAVLVFGSCSVTAQDVPPADEETAPAATEPDRTPEADQLTPEQLYVDFVHFVMLGRYDIALAYGRKLLEHPDAGPATMLDVADRQTHSRQALIWATGNTTVGDIAKQVLERIAQGELLRRKDAARINAYIEGLGGGARAELNNAERLRGSGEYAVPWLIQALQDPKRSALHARIVRTLPKIGKAALNPLVQALNMDDAVVKQIVSRSLGQIGYTQAVPYLKVVAEDASVSDDARRAAAEAVARILPSDHHMFSMSAAQAMFALAEAYWDNASSVRADPREPETNVWYWRDGFLRPTPVPTTIYEEVMATRCCETALGLAPDLEPAVVLWLAANFRREAELGMNVESEELDEARMSLDRTRPADFLRGLYFARSAGPRFCHQVLGRAVETGNSAVALGAIAALDATAGAASLVGAQDERQPLVQALVFPDLVVRIKAALALGRALPTEPFAGAENVVPVLAEALALTGRRHAVVVDPDQENRNRVAGLLGEDNVTTVAHGNLLEALSRARKIMPDVDAIFVASDITKPNLAETLAILRRDFRFANTPVVFLAKPGQEITCENLSLGEPRIDVLPADAPKVALMRRWAEAAGRVGRVPITAQEALDLALQAAHTLRQIAVSNSPVFRFDQAETALIEALHHPVEELRIKSASVLALAPSARAQDAIAAAALDPGNEMSLRLPAFASLAESAKRHGTQLSRENLRALKELTMRSDDPVIRTNASRALGALNLAAANATEIILGGDGAE